MCCFQSGNFLNVRLYLLGLDEGWLMDKDEYRWMDEGWMYKDGWRMYVGGWMKDECIRMDEGWMYKDGWRMNV